MRITIVTESFLPDLNGVAHSVVRVAEHLQARGHEPLVIAPEPAAGRRHDVGSSLPYPVVHVPSLPVLWYSQFRLGMPSRRMAAAMRAHRTDLVHLASPLALGAYGVAVARALGLPSVAVYQTDVPAYFRAYRAGATEAMAWRWLRRLHNAASRTLAPSTASAAALHAHGFERVWLWGRGVDSVRFDPRRRSAGIRRALAPNGELLVGYVGRLAVEKRVDLLAAVSRMSGVRVVIVGAGPVEATLRRAMPGAVFLGARQGRQLARIYASLDVFAHTGPHETFGQTVQEALASGLPVVAPASGGPLDLVEPGRTGYLVPPGDPDAYVDAIAELAADPARRTAYGLAARAAVQGRTWAAIGDELIAHYTAASGGSGYHASQAGTPHADQVSA